MPNNLLKLSITRTWYHRKLPLNSQEWKELRQKAILNHNHSCRFCGITLSKWLICDHIDGNASNNNLDNLGINCPGCDAIRHCGLSGIKGQLILRHSLLNQSQIVKKTYDFYLTNKRHPQPEEVDPLCQKILKHSFKVNKETVGKINNEEGQEIPSTILANLLLHYDYDKIEGVEKIKGFFTEQFRLNFLRWRRELVEK